MRRNDRSFRLADPQVPAPVWVWLVVVLIVCAVAGGAAVYVLATGESLVQ